MKRPVVTDLALDPTFAGSAASEWLAANKAWSVVVVFRRIFTRPFHTTPFFSARFRFLQFARRQCANWFRAFLFSCAYDGRRGCHGSNPVFHHILIRRRRHHSARHTHRLSHAPLFCWSWLETFPVLRRSTLLNRPSRLATSRHAHQRRHPSE